jgi:hypothetical protein
MVRMAKFWIGFSVVALFGAISSSALAAVATNAPISWQGPITISGDTNVATEGTLVGAFNMAGNTVVVNNVTFASFTYPSLATTATSGNFTFTESPGHLLAESSFGSANMPFSGLGQNYQTLLSTAMSTDDNNTLTLTISGLIVGQQYEFQWWLNDSISPNSGFLTTATAVNSVSLDDNTTNATGGVGQFAIGTFTAAPGGTETITFTGTDPTQAPTIDAFQLRAVPEPSTWAQLTTGAVVLGTIVRRKIRR